MLWDQFIDTDAVSLAKRRVENEHPSLLRRLAVTAGPVDMVFQGGGMLGVAHLGALYGLELLGIAPRRVAGTSAGAIFATLLAAHQQSQPPPQSLSESMYYELMGMPAASFLDGDRRARQITSIFLEKRGRLGRLLR